MSKKNFLILFSGGFNSYVVTEFAIQKYKPKKIKLLYVIYKHLNEVELHAARRILKHLQTKYPDIEFNFQVFSLLQSQDTINSDIVENDENSDIQTLLENIMLIAVATSIAITENYKYVVIGIQKYTETCSQNVNNMLIHKMESLLNACKKSVRIIAPFVNKSKKDILDIAYKELKLTDPEIALTWSCENPVIYHVNASGNKDIFLEFTACASCKSCNDRYDGYIGPSDHVIIPFDPDNKEHQKYLHAYNFKFRRCL